MLDYVSLFSCVVVFVGINGKLLGKFSKTKNNFYELATPVTLAGDGVTAISLPTPADEWSTRGWRGWVASGR